MHQFGRNYAKLIAFFVCTAEPDNEIIPCDFNPCENGGTCSIFAVNGSMFCQCPPEFEGNMCRNRVMPVMPTGE